MDSAKISENQVLQLYAARLIFVGANMLATIQGEESPLGSMEAELLYSCGEIEETIQSVAPAILSNFNEKLLELQNRSLQYVTELPENRFVLSLNAFELLVGKSQYEADQSRPANEINTETREYLEHSVKKLLHQFDSVSIRRIIKEHEQESK